MITTTQKNLPPHCSCSFTGFQLFYLAWNLAGFSFWCQQHQLWQNCCYTCFLLLQLLSSVHLGIEKATVMWSKCSTYIRLAMLFFLCSSFSLLWTILRQIRVKWPWNRPISLRPLRMCVLSRSFLAAVLPVVLGWCSNTESGPIRWLSTSSVYKLVLWKQGWTPRKQAYSATKLLQILRNWSYEKVDSRTACFSKLVYFFNSMHKQCESL